jgi:hypothetical protein
VAHMDSDDIAAVLFDMDGTPTRASPWNAPVG